MYGSSYVKEAQGRDIFSSPGRGDRVREGFLEEVSALGLGFKL